MRFKYVARNQNLPTHTDRRDSVIYGYEFVCCRYTDSKQDCGLGRREQVGGRLP
jgi:hypothetical protein